MHPSTRDNSYLYAYVRILENLACISPLVKRIIEELASVEGRN